VKRSGADFWACVIASLLAFAAAALLSRACAVHAQDVERPELPELTLAPCPDLAGIDAEGAAVTFPRTTADCMLARLRLLPPTIRYVSLLEERLRADDQRIELRDRELALAVEQAEVATTSLETALRRMGEAEEDAQQERDLRWLWVGGAIVVVVVLEIVAVWAFSQLRISI
jgi:hypothetical protein